MKNIIITGCSSGMGAETAKYLVRNFDANVVGIARRSDHLAMLSEQISRMDACGKFFPLTSDLSDIDSFSELKKRISEYFSTVHILINNAATIVKKPFGSFTQEDYSRQMGISFKTPFFLIQSLLPLFETPAHIVNITSMGGFQGSVKFNGMSLYSAGKAALSNLTECLASELKDRHISVNAIAPGAVQTEMLETAFPGYKAPLTAVTMGEYIGNFALTGQQYFNGKIIPVSMSTP